MSELEVVYESGTKPEVRYTLVDGFAQVTVDDLDSLMLEIGYFNAEEPELEPVTFDSMGAPIYRHQLPAEEPSDER